MNMRQTAMNQAADRADREGRKMVAFWRNEDRGDGRKMYFYVRPDDGSEGEAPMPDSVYYRHSPGKMVGEF